MHDGRLHDDISRQTYNLKVKCRMHVPAKWADRLASLHALTATRAPQYQRAIGEARMPRNRRCIVNARTATNAPRSEGLPDIVRRRCSLPGRCVDAVDARRQVGLLRT
jgi:hypothetical protein